MAHRPAKDYVGRCQCREMGSYSSRNSYFDAFAFTSQGKVVESVPRQTEPVLKLCHHPSSTPSLDKGTTLHSATIHTINQTQRRRPQHPVLRNAPVTA
ncbi:215_t:CDS:2, partial [Acaulospora colombiana]